MNLQKVPVIQARPFQMLVINGKSKGFHQMKSQMLRCAEAEIFPVLPGISGSTNTICIDILS